MNENDFFTKGMSYAQRHNAEENKFNLSRFKSYFGTSPRICVILWSKIRENANSANMCYYHLLWGLLFLKLYSSEAVLSGIVGCSEKTFRKYCWKSVISIAELKPQIVSSYVNSFPKIIF